MYCVAYESLYFREHHCYNLDQSYYCTFLFLSIYFIIIYLCRFSFYCIETGFLKCVFQSLDNKIHETVETINQLKTNREFFLSFAKDPQQFINKWIISQTRDLKVNVLILIQALMKEMLRFLHF